MMNLTERREIVIEVERVQLIRRRAKTISLFCGNCTAKTDFVSVTDAARLFEVRVDDLFRTIREKEIHMQVSSHSGIHICIASLTAFFQTRYPDSRIRLLAD